MADSADSGAVAGDSRQSPPLRPPTVAIHNDGDVPGKPFKIDLRQKFSFQKVCFHHVLKE